MYYIRQGSTYKVPLGTFYSDDDGKTPVTTLTLSGADDAVVILHDNATVVDIAAYTLAAITGAAGQYHLTLQTGISNTIGQMRVVINDADLIMPFWQDFCVESPSVYDLLHASTADVTAFARALDCIAIGTIGTGSSITSLVTSSITPSPSVADQFKGRIVTFDKNTTTAALRSQSTDITASTSGGVLTVTSLTTAAVSGDTFTIQ